MRVTEQPNVPDNRDRENDSDVKRTPDEVSGSSDCSFSDRLLDLDIYRDKEHLGSYIHPIDVGLLFIQYADKGQDMLHDFMTRARDDGQSLLVEENDQFIYRPAMKFYNHVSI